MASAQLKAALEYAAQGIRVFPIARDTKDQPLVTAWQQNATTDRETIDRWWTAFPDANIGWVPALSGFSLLDLDCHAGQPDGRVELARLEAEHGPLPPTRTLQTPSGGVHMIFRGQMPTSVRKIGPGIDVRGFNVGSTGEVFGFGYGLLPPSTDRGLPYMWTSTVGIAWVPGWLAALADAGSQRKKREAPEGLELDTEAHIAEGETWLTRQPPPADGNASDSFYRYACKLRDIGISAEQSAEMLREFAPQYTLDDINVRVGNAWHYSQNEAGCDTDEAVFEKLDTAGLPPPNPDPPPFTDTGFRDLAWLDAQTFAPITWVWDKLIPANKPLIMTGPAKTGKTTFLLNLALHLTQGATFLGTATRESDVVILVAEDEYGQARDAVRSITRAHGFDTDKVRQHFHIRSVVSEPVQGSHKLAMISDMGEITDTPFMRQVIFPFLQTLDRPVFIIDPLIEFIALDRYKEHAPRGLIHFLNAVARINGTTPIISDHPTLTSVKEGRDIGGTVQMEASFPTVAALKAEDWIENGVGAQQPLTFETKYARHARTRKLSFFRRENSYAYVTEALHGTTEIDVVRGVYQHVMDMLRERVYVHSTNSGYGPASVAQAMGMKEAAVKVALGRAVGLRWLQYNERESLSGGGKIPSHYGQGPIRPDKDEPAPKPEEPSAW
jgi:hypothetical protein